MPTREILTLQLGHYANFVGAHWWNVQENSFRYVQNGHCAVGGENKTEETVDHDVLFREGLNLRGETTFTPRLLLVDLKGALGALPQLGDLYEGPEERAVEKTQAVWYETAVEIQQEERAAKNKFQESLEDPGGASCVDCDLDGDVKVWSDFMYARFHSRTVNTVKEYEHKSTSAVFDAFPLGRGAWKAEKFEEDFCDKIRNYVEECDRLQGFQVLLDATDAFSGLSCSCIEYLRDEYDRKSVLAIPIIPPHYDDYDFTTDEEKCRSIINDSVRVVNAALCFDSLSENSSLFVPLSTGKSGWRRPGEKREFFHTIYDHKLPYHSSAILAGAIDTFTLKHRLKGGDFTLTDLSVDMSVCGRKAAAASVCMPFSLNADADLIDCLDRWEGPLSQIITPNCKLGTNKLMQFITLRGLGENRLKRPPERAGKQKDMPAYKSNTIKEMLTYYLACTTYATANNVTVVENALSTKAPYPKIFDSMVGVGGNIMADRRPNNLSVEKVPVLAGLHSGSEIGGMIESLHTEARKIKIARLHRFTEAGLERDEFNECLDSLFDFRERYVDEYQL